MIVLFRLCLRFIISVAECGGFFFFFFICTQQCVGVNFWKKTEEKMQNVQVSTKVTENKKVASAVANGGVVDGVKELLHPGVAQPPESECRVPRVASTRDQQHPPSSPHADRNFQASVVADKYLLLDQPEGSSLYRCVDVKTQEELVCKVKQMQNLNAI